MTEGSQVSFVIDTDVMVDYLSGVSAVRGVVDGLPRADTGISVVTWGEALDGAFGGRSPEEGEQGVRDFGAGRLLLEVTVDIAETFGRLRCHLRKRGKSIDDSDLLIAATALEYNATLVTRNVKHFERIPDLKLLVP
jgi:tRNA(fMet)-specific endonuclease VapC